MPRLSDLEFASNALYVAYKASAEPQDVHLDIDTAGVATDDGATFFLQMLLDSINGGAAGGSLFAPTVGMAEVISGPKATPGSYGPKYNYALRIAGMAPLFLRTIVEDARHAGFEHAVTSMQWVGSLPLDGGPLCVREPMIRAWLEDDTSYLDRWPTLGFPVQDGETSGAIVRIALADPIVPDIRRALEALCVRWVNATRNYVSGEGEEIDFNPLLVLPRFGRGKNELCARFDGYRCKPEPARAVLLNMLQRFHETIAPLVEVEVRL